MPGLFQLYALLYIFSTHMTNRIDTVIKRIHSHMSRLFQMYWQNLFSSFHVC